jgi:hypothetical protein
MWALLASNSFWLVRHKPHHPFRHGRAVMLMLKTRHALRINLLAQRFLTDIQ